MTDKNKKLLIIILSALVAALAVALVVVLLVGPGSGDSSLDNTSGPEVGTYYFDAGNQEYTLTLNEGRRFTLYIKGGTESGSYTLSDKALSLDFSAEGVQTIEAAMEDNVVTLTYQGATMRFLKKVTYTVSFESNGGSALEAQSVLNGKSFAQPNDPVREGFVFVGWYADSEFKAPFAFQAEPITSDMTLYARWSEALLGGMEYTVEFDANYADAENPEAMITTGGKLFSLPAVSREGYEFKGWWVSMLENGERLSYRYDAGMSLEGNTTLYALWQGKEEGNKLPAPVVNVSAGSLNWESVPGARSYTVTVINSDGVALISDESTSATTFNVPFDSFEAGEYEIRVVALANTGDSNNSEAVRYYNNKALGKVSAFEVVDSVLIFNTVENAQKYLITVVCGNPDHQHTRFDNGTSRTFNFANCAMTEEGIRFTVTAEAEGYGSSTSREFVYRRDLNAVEGLRYDEATQTVFWNEVPNAAYYMVSVQCGNAEHDHAFFHNGSQTSVSLRECDACEGGIVVKVYPKTNGYNSPKASETVVNKSGLATPSDFRVVGTLMTWGAVNGATGYEVQIGDKLHNVTEPMFDLADHINWVEGSEYAVSVRALGDVKSLWSDVQNLRYAELSEQLRYAQNTLYWQNTIGATAYEVQVNDGEIIRVENGLTSVQVALTRAGNNVLKVRFVDGTARSEWVSMEVYAHAVTFDTRGGSQIPMQYLAVGDKIQLPTTGKTGYDFADWYNVPGGPASNGMAYSDDLFAESGSIVLYAHYTPSKFTITYNYGIGGTSDKLTDEVAYESHYQLTVPVANQDGRFFGGWFSAPYGMGVRYTDSRGNSLVPWDDVKGADVYAFWIDSALNFTKTKVSGVDAYIVTAGEQIALLDEVTIPVTYNGLPVLMVGGNAFVDCTSLKIINLPASLDQISLITPFAGCSRLEAVNVYPVEGVNNPRYWSEDGVLFDNGTASVAQPKLQFMPLAKTGTYRIPDGIKEIPERAFADALLSRVIIPASVTKIGNEAFANCTKLTSVMFESVSGERGLSIGTRAFKDCTALEKIVLPARLQSINLTKYTISGDEVTIADTQNAFDGCDALVSITVVPGCANYKSVDGVLYSGDGKTLRYCPTTLDGSFIVPNGVIAVDPGAFIGCHELDEVFFPNTVTLIGECAFYGLNEDLTKITFGGNGMSDVIIDKFAFNGCSALEEVVFESGSCINTLGERAFYECASLRSFQIPASMTKIGREAFGKCSSLATISFAENGKTLAFGEGVFQECVSLTTVDLPANVSEIPGIFGGCSNLQEVNVAEDNPYLTSQDGVVFDKEITEVLFFPQGKSGVYMLPETVTSIANGVFMGVKNLDRLIISNAVTSIGERAFDSSAIKEILFMGGEPGAELVIGANAFRAATFGILTLPSHTTVIADSAFDSVSCTDVVLNDGLVSLGNYAFYGATISGSTSSGGSGAIEIPGTVKTIGDYCFAMGGNAVKVTIPQTGAQLETIGSHAFYGNEKITTMNIPAAVTSIGDYAFANCSKVRTIKFEDNSSLKTIGGYAFYQCGGSGGWSGGYMTTITIPKSVTSIGAYAFADTALRNVYFEEGGTEDLVLGSVYVYSYLDYNGMPARLIERGHVFDSCDYLEKVELPSRLTEIGPYCFYYAAYNVGEMNVTLGEDSRLATIGDYAFYGCNLKTFEIPNTVRNLDPVVSDELDYSYDRLAIGHYAFANNYNTLESIAFEKGGTEPLTIGESAFYNNDMLVSMELPARLAPYTSYTGEVYDGLAGGNAVFDESSGIQDITIEEGGMYYVDVDGVIYTADLTELILCPAGKTGSVTIPSQVTKIHDRAFFKSQLEEITFEGGTEPMTIGDEAFKRANRLKEIVLPSNVVSLGEGAFAMSAYDGSALESITLSKNLEAFDGGMIEYCSSLKAIYVEDGCINFVSDNGVLYSADMTMLICYPTSREGESYTVPDGVLSISESGFGGNSYLKTVILPDGLVEIKQYAFSLCTALENVCIPNTVELIDNWGFSNCYALSNLTFQMGGTTKMIVGKYAFQGISTANLVLPATMTAIANYGFINAKIQNLSFEEGSKLYSLADQVFQNVPLVNVVLPDGLASIGYGTFTNCSSLVSVTFGEGLTTIGDATFTGSSVETVHFPATLQNMGIETFKDCANLKEVTFAPFSKLTVLPEATFYNSGLERITIPASIKEIVDAENGVGVFEGCTDLVSVTFAEGSQLVKIGAYAFKNCKSLLAFDIPATVSTLGTYAFEHCESLTSVTIPASTTSLGTGVFSTCFNLAEVILETRTTELPGWTFANCRSLKEITIPATVTTIGDYCFTNSMVERIYVAEGNTAFASVEGVLFSADLSQILLYPEQKQDVFFTVPNTVTSIPADVVNKNEYLKELIFEDGELPLEIQEDAFKDMDGLVKVQLPERLTEIGPAAFQNCSALMFVNIPATATEDTFGDGAFSGCGKLYEIRNDSALKIKAGDRDYGDVARYALNIYSSADGQSIFHEDENGFVTFTKEENGQTHVCLVGYVGTDMELIVPENVTQIYDSALVGLPITRVVLPEGLQTVRIEAFFECKELEEVVLPSTLQTISDYAFKNCESLVRVIVPESVTQMGYHAFLGCGDVQLLMEHTRQPDNVNEWQQDWTNAGVVVWGYDGVKHTYTFETNYEEEVQSISTAYPIMLPTMVRDGYVFEGWYTSPEFEGKPVQGAYYSSSQTTLYAKWVSEEDFKPTVGTGFDNPIEIQIGQTVTIRITEPGQKVYLHVYVGGSTPAYLYSNSSDDVRLDAQKYDGGELGDQWKGTLLTDVDGDGDYCYLFGGHNAIVIYVYDGESTGTFEITLDYYHE